MSRIWSFSALKSFKQCPHQFQQVKLLKRFIQGPTAATEFGTFIHAAFEDTIKANTVGELPEVAKPYQPLMETVLAVPGIKLVEHEMGLTRMGEACPYSATLAEGNAVRGIADLVVINGDRATVLDWKTSKSAKYADTKQLHLMARMVMAHYPQVQHVRGILVFVVAGAMETQDYYRTNYDTMWADWAQAMMLAEHALKNDHQIKKPSPLCPWCPVTDCEHWELPKPKRTR